MSIDLKDAVNEAKKFSRMIKSLEKLQEVAEVLAGADNVRAELEAKSEGLRQTIEQRTAELDEANKVLQDARGAIEAKLAEAEAQAQQIIDRASAQAREHLAEAESRNETLREENATLIDYINAHTEQRQALEAELSDLEVKLAKAREAARQILG